MARINIQKELDYLDKKEIIGFELGLTDGQMIKKNEMSKYLKKCYCESTMVECPVRINLNFKYYYDKKNRVCILFSKSWFLKAWEYDPIKFPLIAKTIIVKIYISKNDFTIGGLGRQYFLHLFDRNKQHWDIDDECYVTNCIEFNQCPLVIAISKLPHKKYVTRLNNIDEIINN
ncbi:hypothetical protein [Flavobacterium sp. ASV13]|uniref:hypothetical protein n=1 Tax=Flavobacterium sp. ASV13 TaxID=1506583 RepID=UPI000551355C|nr:hypothetical protein [Flavobacterium sp. ASV13]